MNEKNTLWDENVSEVSFLLQNRSYFHQIIQNMTIDIHMSYNCCKSLNNLVCDYFLDNDNQNQNLESTKPERMLLFIKPLHNS